MTDPRPTIRLADFPRAIRDGSYTVDIEWSRLESWIEEQAGIHLNLAPDFQRGHVWTMPQRTAYVEAKLLGYIPHDVIRFNQPGWMASFDGEFVIVDGLQRLTTARMFMRDEVPVLGGYVHSQIEDRARFRWYVRFNMNVNTLPTRAKVLEWYLQLNAGGTPHSAEEIARVRALLAAEETQCRP